VYVGNGTNYSVFDSIQYAVDEKIGNIITASYGACETAFTPTVFNQLDAILSQGASQGQTLIASSGDQGSTACQTDTQLTTAQQQALAVNYPASSKYVTGVGGTEIIAANSVDTNSTYWDAETPGSDILTSAKIYIPEVAWNDDVVAGASSPANGGGLSASGGGKSTFYTSKPSFQTGVTGIPADSARDVPDVALYSSPEYPGYLYCTSDQTSWQSGQTGSCGSGFRASSSDNTLTIAGGTSFAAPIFAGMVAIINQKANFPTGQGNINSNLYTLASNAVTYASAFHDVTTGNNYCTAGTTFGYCSSSGATEGYAAGVGYDQVTGLGSVNLNNLATAWSGGTTTLIGTTTTISPSSTAPALNANDTFTITVAPVTGATVPSGTVAISVDGAAVIDETLSNNGTYAYVTSFATTGAHSIVAQYQGDATHAASTGVATVTVPGGSSGTGTFTLTPSNSSAGTPTLTVSQGTSGSETITVTPAGGYTGTVYLTFDTSNDTALANLCYGFTNTLSNGDGSVSVTSATAATTQLTFDTNAADCATAALSKTGTHNMRRLGHAKSASNSVPANPSRAPLAVAFAGLLLTGFLGRGSRKLRNLAAVIALLAIGLAVSACGGGSGGGGGGGGVTDPAKGTYTITVFGQDSATATITGQTTYSFTID
jgi:subtilase family serine protease